MKADFAQGSATLGGPDGHPEGVVALILSYNNEQFLSKAIDSALEQQVNFPYRIWIHDDASTDGSADVITDYVSQHRGTIFAVLQRNNKRSRGVAIRNEMLKRVPGELIANLDGDDYWTCAEKVQRQADSLSCDPAAVLSHHSYTVMQESNGSCTFVPALPPKWHGLSARSLALRNQLGSPTVMVRKSSVPRTPADFAQGAYRDWVLWAMVANSGKILSINENMAVHRRHSNNTSSIPTDQVEARTRLTEDFMMSWLDQRDGKYWSRARMHRRIGISLKEVLGPRGHRYYDRMVDAYWRRYS